MVVLSKFKVIGLLAFLLIIMSGAASAIGIGKSGYGVEFPVGFFYSGTRGWYGSAGFMFGKEFIDLKSHGESPMTSMEGMIVDGTVGKKDYSYSVGYGGRYDFGLGGGAIRGTVLVGRTNEKDNFLSRGQKAYGVEISLAAAIGLRVGIFSAERTHVTKLITSIGFGI